MIDNKVHHQLHTSLLQLGLEVVQIIIGSIDGVNSLVIRYVVAHVRLGTLVHLNGSVIATVLKDNRSC